MDSNSLMPYPNIIYEHFFDISLLKYDQWYEIEILNPYGSVHALALLHLYLYKLILTFNLKILKLPID